MAALDAAMMVKSFPVIPSRTSLCMPLETVKRGRDTRLNNKTLTSWRLGCCLVGEAQGVR
jgi:hypothetical protein